MGELKRQRSIENKKLKEKEPSSKREPKTKEPARPSYFTKYLQKMALNRAGKGSFIGPQARRFREFIEANHKALHNMKKDFIVSRAKKHSYKRKNGDKKLLLLDLDETLIHCIDAYPGARRFDMEVDFINDEGEQLQGLLNIRPFAAEFLREMSQHFEVVIFTASMKYYADRILRILDPKKEFISSVFTREHCSKTKTDRLVKDLSIFKHIPLNEMILVDNNMYCMWPQPHLGIPVLSFEHERNDRELQSLTEFLLHLKDHKNHSQVLKDHFKIHELQNQFGIDSYVKLFAST